MIHHANKSGVYRGSTAIPAGCDLIVEVEATAEKRKMSCFKLKDGSNKFEELEFKVRGIDIPTGGHSAVVDWLGEATKTVTQNEAIRMFLEKNADKWFTYEMIVEKLGNVDGDNPLSLNTVRSECNTLFKKDIIIKSEDKELKRSMGLDDIRQAVVKFNKASF